MPIASTSLPIQGFDLTNPQSVKVFQTQLVQQLSQIQSVLNQLPTSQSILNGSGALQQSALNLVMFGFSATGTNQTVSCAGATSVAGVITISAGLTLALHNVPFGIPIQIRVTPSSGGPFTFTITATDPTGTAYSRVEGFRSNAVTALTSGISVPAAGFINFIGLSSSSTAFGTSIEFTY